MHGRPAGVASASTVGQDSITSPFVADIVEGNPDRTNLAYVKGRRHWIAGPRNHPAIRHLELGRLGYPGRPAPLLTSTLLFIGEGSDIGVGPGGRVPDDMPREIVTNYGEPWFRAYDKATGAVVWETRLEAGTTGSPMTYMHAGRQYIVIPIGGRSVPGQWVAPRLP